MKNNNYFTISFTLYSEKSITERMWEDLLLWAWGENELTRWSSYDSYGREIASYYIWTSVFILVHEFKTKICDLCKKSTQYRM